MVLKTIFRIYTNPKHMIDPTKKAIQHRTTFFIQREKNKQGKIGMEKIYMWFHDHVQWKP